ncbi:uncharacterized protein BXZ73DRAFT_104899 [Epithele typhae]|uniref:uncharacterized protein n=1 Tax=Epithele typhae TaxID=378194 RepID=UPI002007443D|nr:uncharacterized protein BXZ73DRAFT_104899 [Epithele typhae]KAH9919789.1 hypothetical protein BXZ73DRAFT_104899 [Epithele typhae]
MNPISLLSLHDDVLLAIFSFLGRDDALAISTTSRRAYPLAISRVFANVCWDRDLKVNDKDASEARALSRYMRAPEPFSQVSRVQHLRHFTLRHFCDVDVPPLRELLSQASNLRTIEIHSFEFFVHQDRLLVDAIGAMHNLEQARLIDVGPETVASLPEILSSRCLASLTLEFDEMHFESGDIDLAALVSGLSSMQSLHTLALVSYLVPTDSLRLPNPIQTVLPSILHLSFRCLAQIPPGIIPLCPNTITLSLLLNAEGGQPVIFPMEEEDRWPVGLKRLDVPSIAFIPRAASRRIGHVGSLAYGASTPISNSIDFCDTLDLLSAVRPTALELHTAPTMRDPGRVWDTLCGAAPGLRSLEIVVAPGEYDVRQYMEPLLAAVRSNSLTLVHLSLRFPPIPQYYHASSIAEVDGWRATESRRVEALRPLPLRIVEAVPTLRVLSISSCLPGSTGFDTRRGRARHEGLDAEVMAELARENAIEQRWGPTSEFVSPALRRLRELRMEIPRDERWWWVEGDGAARTPVEIWREAGERARKLIGHRDFDPATSLDGFYSAKYRYER